MEKRSHRRSRDLDVLAAFQGLVSNEIGMRADIHDGLGANHSLQRAEYRCARPIISRSSHPACTARPVHTKYMVKHRGPPSQTWRTFLRNHAEAIAAIDLCVVPTVTFECLFAFLVVGHGRRQLIWFAVTRHPTAEWLAQQIVEAFPWDTAPRYLIRDNDGAYGQAFTNRVRTMGIRDRPIAPRSPWQNPYVERLIGTLRRDCLDHVLIFGERHLRRILTLYSVYYNETRTHLGLGKDAPQPRPIQRCGTLLATPILSGLHNRYSRI